MWEVLDASFLAAGLRLAVPVLLAAQGGLFTDRVNIFNVALEAMMLMGAFAAVAMDFWTGSPFFGLVGGLLAGLLVGLLFAVFTMELRADPIMAGIALNLLMGGLTVVLLQALFDVRGLFQSGRIALLPQVHLPGVERFPLVGRMLEGNNAVFYLAFLSVPLVHGLLYRTRFGLRLRSVGEYTPAAEAAGVNPRFYQLAGILMSGLFSGIAGAWLSLSSLGMFSQNMTAGRGFIALAAILFGRSTPVGILLASLVFGFAEALAIRLQGLGVPTQLVLMIPYAATVISLAIVALRRRSGWARTQTAR
ncbi:ABC transporter permease [Limnochorda pilosa]|uniref:Sugar ABC transporter permease n=1 Tax=Limnochorda pilosa TaxID=1555112 RepID=A0A0K2SLK6_LIMPI|nr:ABC transporter permease [Limnochorda pilosa]BAS27892.1 sugar ABC transporter permease [Limnochorda pilosa]